MTTGAMASGYYVMTEIQHDNSKKPGKPFTKGDARINRKGRPKSFDKLRELAQQIANEVQTSKDGAVSMTTIEAILRRWASSGNAQLQRQFVEVAFGKVPDKVEVTGQDGGPVEISDARDRLARQLAARDASEEAREGDSAA